MRTTLGLIGLEVGLALAYGVLILKQGQATHLLDFNGLRSLPSLLQAAHLFALGLLCLGLIGLRRRMSHRVSWFLPAAIALLCFYGGLDELTKLHLLLDQVDWKIIYLGWLVAIPVFGWRDLRWLWQSHRSTIGWILAGLSIFLLGGFGAEALKGAIATELSAHTSAQIVFLSEHGRIVVEELAELIGETIILYAFAGFTLKALTSTQTSP